MAEKDERRLPAKPRLKLSGRPKEEESPGLRTRGSGVGPPAKTTLLTGRGRSGSLHQRRVRAAALGPAAGSGRGSRVGKTSVLTPGPAEGPWRGPPPAGSRGARVGAVRDRWPSARRRLGKSPATEARSGREKTRELPGLAPPRSRS